MIIKVIIKLLNSKIKGIRLSGDNKSGNKSDYKNNDDYMSDKNDI